MQTFLTLGLALCLLATLGVLVFGLIGMARGQSPEQSNRMMRWRVTFQAGALILLMLLLLILRR